jgi:hypothetical protein
VEGTKSLWKEKGSRLGQSNVTEACASMNGGGGAVVLGVPVIEALRTTSDGVNCCGVERRVVRAHFICRGGGRRAIVESEGAGGRGASLWR